MNNSTLRFIAVCLCVAHLTLGSAAFSNAAQAELKQLTTTIDLQLYEDSKADIEGFLDKSIQHYWRPGVKLEVNYDTGGLGALAAMWFRGYEMLGEKRYLQAGLEFVDAILQTQREDGMFPSQAVLQRKGKSQARGNARLEDEYNFVQFTLVCYAYKLTGEQKYLDAALRHAETLRSCQDPGRDQTWLGPWPHTYHGNVAPKPGEGYRTGYMLNDYVTWDGMRTMIMAYKLSGDKKYIDRLNRLPAYIVGANVGLGNVRGWRGQTDAFNESTWQRSFEGPLIDPRNFNRFACPMLTFFSAVMNKDVGLNMVQEGYTWMRSMEHRNGWSYKYTYDGREATTGEYRNLLRPQRHLRTKVVLDPVEKLLEVAAQGGVNALRDWYGPRPVKYNREQYRSARIAAAKRVTNENLTVRLWLLKEHELVMGKFLERVRQRPIKSASLELADGWLWRWHRRIVRPVPYRGWVTWQYVWDVRVALGAIDRDTAAWGGRGLESAGAPTWFFPSWDTVGDWSTKAVEVESWIDLPLKPEFVHVQSVRLEPAKMTLKLAEIAEVKPIFTPSNVTCKTGTWTVDKEVCWVQPRMLKDIDPSVVRPRYPREGKIMVHAGLPHGFPATATVTFTSSDGKHTATCEVSVVK